MKTTRTFTIPLEADAIRRIGITAAHMQISKTEFMRRAIMQALHLHEPSTYDDEV